MQPQEVLSWTLTINPLFPAEPGGPTGPLEPWKQVKLSEGAQETKTSANNEKLSNGVLYPKIAFLSLNISAHVPACSLGLNQITCSQDMSVRTALDLADRPKQKEKTPLTASPLRPGPPGAPTGPAEPGRPCEPIKPSGPGSPRSPWKSNTRQSSIIKMEHNTRFILFSLSPTLCPRRPSLPGGPSDPASP